MKIHSPVTLILIFVALDIIFAQLDLFNDQESAFSNQEYNDFYEEDFVFEGNSIRENRVLFTPDALFFNQSSVCIPVISEFTISNTFEVDLVIYGISSSDTQFHPILSVPYYIQPNSEIRIQTLFLPYFPRVSTSVFTLNTSLGEYRDDVSGKGIANPYGVHPYLNNRAFVGVPWQDQSIVVFNPHDHKLNILEVFTSEDFLTLKGRPLLNSEKSATITSHLDDSSVSSKTLWTIDSNSSKEVISFTLMTKLRVGSYEGFIHLRTDVDKMIIPVKMDLSSGGLSLTVSDLSFGVFTRKFEKRVVEVSFWNYGGENVLITNIIPLQQDNRLVVEILPNPLVPAVQSSPTKVANLVFTAKNNDRIYGKLLVTTNDTNSVYAAFEVTYQGFILQGKLYISPANTTFSIQSTRPNEIATVSKHIYLSNRYNTAVRVNSVFVATCSEFLSINSTQIVTTVAESFRAFSPLTVGLDQQSFLSRKEATPKTCWLEVVTNITSHRVPIHIISGKLELESSDAVSVTTYLVISFGNGMIILHGFLDCQRH